MRRTRFRWCIFKIPSLGFVCRTITRYSTIQRYKISFLNKSLSNSSNSPCSTDILGSQSACHWQQLGREDVLVQILTAQLSIDPMLWSAKSKQLIKCFKTLKIYYLSQEVIHNWQILDIITLFSLAKLTNRKSKNEYWTLHYQFMRFFSNFCILFHIHFAWIFAEYCAKICVIQTHQSWVSQRLWFSVDSILKTVQWRRWCKEISYLGIMWILRNISIVTELFSNFQVFSNQINFFLGSVCINRKKSKINQTCSNGYEWVGNILVCLK